MSADEDQFVIGVDIGSTSVRCHIYDKKIKVRGSSSRPIEVLHPQPGYSELDPEVLLQQFTSCIKEAISNSSIDTKKITSMGIATQRNTFLTWNRETGKYFHNFITWQDLRASQYAKSWNSSLTLKGLNSGSSLLHFFSRQKRYLAGSIIKFTSVMVTMRLLYIISTNEEVGKCMRDGKLMFGCIDTWLVWKLTGGQTFATDYSSASGTGLYDPFQLVWSSLIWNILSIPLYIAPEVKDTSGYFGACLPEFFGFEIPITALVADQQSAMFAQCCYEPGDIKVTMGTGSFIDVNTGKKPHTSLAGMYPLVGWKYGDELTYIVEGNASDTSTVIEWMKSIDMFHDVATLNDLVTSVPDSGGVYFVPAFSGIQAPINDDHAVTSMFGMGPNTTKAHIMRAVLESLAFRVKLLCETVLSETKLKLTDIHVDGGVSKNDFVMQMIADLTSQNVVRSTVSDMTCLGAALLAGLSVRVWKDKSEFKSMKLIDRVFEPQANWNKYKPIVQEWERALKRSLNWYPPDRHVVVNTKAESQVDKDNVASSKSEK